MWRRWRRHCNRAEADKPRNGNCPALHAAIRKYGEEAFAVEEVATFATWEETIAEEMRLIALLGTKAPVGYNLTDGGEGQQGREVSDEERKRLSDIGRGRKWSAKQRAMHSARCKGRKMSEEQKAKMRGRVVSQATRDLMSAQRKGIPLSLERVEAMRIAATGRKHSAETRAKMSAWQVGKKMSQETKDRIAARARGRVATPEAREANRRASTGRRQSEETIARMREAKAAKSKPVICHQTGERFASLSYAGKQLGITPTNIRMVLQGKVRAAKGYTFEYAP